MENIKMIYKWPPNDRFFLKDKSGQGNILKIFKANQITYPLWFAINNLMSI